jgi:hypothetical protein
MSTLSAFDEVMLTIKDHGDLKSWTGFNSSQR